MINGLITKSEPAPLHYYQADAKRAILNEWAQGRRKTLAVLPTGSGKTRLAGSLIWDYSQEGLRSLFLAHTRKLTRQAALSIEEAYHIPANIEMGGERADDGPLTCATIQTIARRLPPKDSFDLLVIDEGHRVRSKGYTKILKYFDQANVLLITATPRRGDQKSLMGQDACDSLAYDVPLSQLIEEGYLAPLTIHNIPIEIKVEHEGEGDFKDEEVGHAIEPYLESCADALIEHGRGRCALAFLPLIATSKKFTKLLQERGIKTAHVDGEMDEGQVAQILRDLEGGKLQCVCCSMILTEGVDVKPVNCIMNLRLTRSWTLYTQICGRGTRLYDPIKDGGGWPKKDDCILLDPLWLCEQHSLIQRPSCLIASSPEQAEEIDREFKKSGGKKSLMEAVKDAKSGHEERLKERLKEMAERRARVINPMEMFISINKPELAEYEPIAPWEEWPMTENQRNTLSKAGIDIEAVKGMGHANLLVKSIIERRANGLATLKMAKFAMDLKMLDAYQAPFEEVRNWINSRKK